MHQASHGESGRDIWGWYGPNIKHIQRAQRKRTWVIWYQRIAHDSEECTRILPPKAYPASPSERAKNFYGGQVGGRFPFDCTRTAPTPRTLNGAPTYIRDAYCPKPGSGFLQFWTVSAKFKLGEATSEHKGSMPINGYTRLGMKDREVGIIFVNAKVTSRKRTSSSLYVRGETKEQTITAVLTTSPAGDIWLC